MKPSRHSRWVPLHTTTPSGKTLFVCLMCGDITPVPTEACKEAPAVGTAGQTLPCAVLEEIHAALIDGGEKEDVQTGRLQLYIGETRGGRTPITWISPTGWHSTVGLTDNRLATTLSSATQRQRWYGISRALPPRYSQFERETIACILARNVSQAVFFARQLLGPGSYKAWRYEKFEEEEEQDGTDS